MNKKDWLPIGLAVLFCLGFGLALFAKPVLNGADPYYYFAFSCGHIDSLGDKGFTSEFLFSVLPCDVFVWKVVSIILVLCTSILIGLIGLEIFGQKGLWAAPLSWMSVVLPFSFASLEPTQIGFVFCVASLLFLVKKRYLVSLLLIVLAGLVWQGSLVFLALEGLIFWPYLLLAVPLILRNWTDFWGAIVTRMDVGERMSLASVNLNGFVFPIPIILLVFFFFWSYRIYFDSKEFLKIRTWFNTQVHKPFFVALIASIVLASMGFKWMLVGLPFFTIHLTGTWISLETKFEKAYLVGVLIVFVLGSFVMIPNDIPTPIQLEAVHTTELLASDSNGLIQNDWSFGHWFLSDGFVPSREFGPGLNPNFFACDRRPILTELDLNSEFELVWFKETFRIYSCKAMRQ